MLRFGRLASIALSALLFALAARAQQQQYDDRHHWDAFAGYSRTGNLDGWQGAVHWKSAVPLLGIEAGGSGYGYGNPSQVYAYQVGPRLTFTGFKISAFAHFLVGQQVLTGNGISGDAMSYLAGGGLDLPIYSRFKWRAEADYANGFESNFAIASHLRYSTGPVYRF